MAAYLSLKRKSDGEIVQGGKLILLDNEMREAFGEPSEDNDWLWNWMDTIGMSAAIFGDFESAKKHWYHMDKGRKIIDYLEEHFTNNSFHGR